MHPGRDRARLSVHGLRPVTLSHQLMLMRGACRMQYALKIDKLERRKDPRGGTVKAEHKVRAVDIGSSTYVQGQSLLLLLGITSVKAV